MIMPQTSSRHVLCVFLGHRWAEWIYHSGEFATPAGALHFHDSPTHRSRCCGRCEVREEELVQFLDDHAIESLARRLAVRG
jgi:hypothetical protein